MNQKLKTVKFSSLSEMISNRILLLVLCYLLFSLSLQAQTPNGYLDFGTTASNTTATTTNTGFGGVRVGSAGGSFTLQNPGQTIGTNAELRGIAPTSASINSVGITSTEYGTAATAFTISFEMQLSGGSSGLWYFFAGNGTSFAAAQTAAFTSSQVFASLRWTFGASNAITTDYRNNATWTTVSGTPFAQNRSYQVSIIGNNSTSTVNYGLSNAYSVAAGKFDLWVNGVLVADELSKGAITASTTINAFRFYAESSTGNVAQLAIDNVRWYNSCVLPATHLNFVNVPATGNSSSNLSSYTVEARSGSATGPLANQFTGNITLSKFSGTGNLSGTLTQAAVAGVATYSNTQFDAAGLYSLLASGSAPLYADTSDNININGGGPCVPPSTQASGISLSATGASSLTAAWTPGNGSGTLLVIRPTAQTSVDPSNGSAYVPNADYALAEQINTSNRVIFKNSGSSASASGLNSQTSYTITAYEYNSTGDCYLLSSPVSASVYTLSPEPAAHSATFTATATSPTTIDLNFSAASTISDADGYLILMKQGSAPTGVPADASAYTLSSSIGDATLVKIITDPAATASSINGLTHSTNYYFQLIPFNWDNSNSSTYNYLSSASIPTANDTTDVLSNPIIGSVSVSNVLNTTARVQGNISSDGGASISSRGLVWAITSLNSNPVIGGLSCTQVSTSGTTGAFTIDLNSLPINTQISVVTYATNSVGTAYSAVQTFQTLSPASQMSFGTLPPVSGIAGSTLSTFTVELRRPDNSVDAEYTGPVVLSKNSGSGILSGTLTVNAVAGIATFSNIKLNLAGTYTLMASAGSFSSITSASINITATAINLAYQNFENSPASPNWTYTGTGALSSVTSRFVGAQSYQLTGTNTIVFDNIDISQYSNVSFSVAYGATGVDTDEDLFVDVSYDNGSTWTGLGSAQLVDGSSNLSLNINSINSARTPTGTNPYVYTVPSGESQIRLRFRSGADAPDANEFFFIDEVKVMGLYNSNPAVFKNPASLSGFVSTGIASASTQQSFTVFGNNIADSVVLTASSGYEISLSSGASFVPNSSIVLYAVNGSLTSTNIYVRFKPSSLTDITGSISITGAGFTTVNIPLSSELINLSVGDIAFVGFDGVGPDKFSFVALKDIPENTRIWFTDKSWDGSLATAAFTSAEASGVWTSPSGGITKGTVVTMFTDPTPSVNVGSGTLVSGLSSVGEQLFAYQGAISDPYFIAGFTSGNIINAGTPQIFETWIPATLTNGVNFIRPASGLPASSYLTNASQINTLSAQRTAIHDTLNWTSGLGSVSFPTWTFKILEEEPTLSATFGTTTAINNNSMTLNFSGGNGSNCIIVMSSNPTITAIPADGTNYTANSVYGSGAAIASNEFVVYNGPVSTAQINVSNLFSGTTYYFNIYSYNGSANTINYLTSSYGSSNETTTGSSLSQLSDIITHPTFVEPSSIDYFNYQNSSDLTLSNSLESAMFTIRDGGVSNDIDNAATILSSISFKIENYQTLRRIALYQGTTELAEVAVNDSIVVFSGLSLNVNDNSSTDISLRTSFQSVQTDLVQIKYTVYEVSSSISGSRFALTNAGAASSSTAANRNRIDVNAIKLSFVQQPQNSITGTNLNPAPTVMAIDTFANRDLEFNFIVDLSSNATISPSSTLSVAAVQGLATFNSISFVNPASTIVLNASSFGMQGASSSTFDVTYNPIAGDVYMSEISYESTQEWVELYNKTDYPINIGNWYITDHSTYPASGEGDCIIPSGTILPAKSYLVISTSGTGTLATDLTDITGEVLSIAGPRGSGSRPTLNNSGDNLALYTSSSGGILMDGSLSVNFPDISNTSTISIQRIANKPWADDAFGRSTNVIASSVFTNSSPGTFGAVALQSSNTIPSGTVIPSNQIIELSGYTLTINAQPSGLLQLKGSSTSDIIINAPAVSLSFDQSVVGTSNRIRNFKTYGQVSLVANLLVSGTLDLDSGSIDLNGKSLTYSGSVMMAGNHSIDASKNNSNLIFNNTSLLNIPQAMLNDTIHQLSIAGAGGITINEPFYISNQLLLNGGSINQANQAQLHILNNATNAITRTSGYIKSPLVRTIAASSNGSGTYLFPLGNTKYTPIEVLNPITGAGSDVTVLAYAADSSSNGTAGTGMSTLYQSRYFYAEVLSGLSSFVSAAIRITDTSAFAGNALAKSASMNGSYSRVSLQAPVSGVYTSDVLNSFGYFNTGDTVTVSGTADLNLKAYFEGLYLGAGTMTAAPYNSDNSLPNTIADTIMVELHAANGTYDKLFETIGTIDTDGNAQISFPSSVIGNYYYLVIKHRNSVETWSADSLLMGATTAYDFSTGAAQAFGNNMVDDGTGIFMIYSGDINQDGSVDFLDYPDLDLGSTNGDLGYLQTDLNGDASVDFLDYPMIDLNSTNGVVLMRP